MNLETMGPLLIQIPLVAAFMWFTLKLNEANSRAQTKRDQEWREFLQEERKLRNEGMARLAEEIKSLHPLVRETNTLITKHDEWGRNIAETRVTRKPPSKKA